VQYFKVDVAPKPVQKAAPRDASIAQLRKTLKKLAA
jgi:hypothetical protein